MRVLEITTYDAILGYDWLKSHNPMVCHWELKTMQFQEAGKPVYLHGVPSEQLSVGTMSPEQFIKMQKGNDIWALAMVQYNNIPDTAATPPEISEVLEEFKDIFEEPSQLPPHIDYAHYIPLFPGSVPVNTRPYRYSPMHKDEIEKQVKTLLSSGLITPSTNSFASPILLV
jgi:hypothetical protein